jgi:hypothetical protein
MGTVFPLHQADSLTMPLADGATLRVIPFRESPRVAMAFYGPGGGDAGGAVLTARRARLLASWLLRLADECGTPAARPLSALGRGISPRDAEAALAGLARLAVSVLADWCVMDVLDEGARLRRLRVAFSDPSKAAIARKLEKCADDDRVTRSLPPMASMAVPLVGRMRTLGVMTFLAADPRRSYREPERELGRELGRLAGLVLESGPPAGKLPATAGRRRDAVHRAPRSNPSAR